MSSFPDPTGAHARMRDRVADAIDRVWSPGDVDEDDERGRLIGAVMEPVSALMERGKELHLIDAGIIKRLREPKKDAANLHVALALALGVQPQETDARLIARVRNLAESGAPSGLFDLPVPRRERDTREETAR